MTARPPRRFAECSEPPRSSLDDSKWNPPPIRLAIAEIVELPYPHNLGECLWGQRHRALVAEEGDDPDGHRRAYERLIAELGPDRVAQCSYHASDWKRATEIACKLLDEGTVRSGEPGERATALGATRDVAMAVYELFARPISHADGELCDGQHRTCAMRVAGAIRCPIEVD